MKIENLKQLQRLIKLCRQTGVEAIEVDGIKMNLGPAPQIYIKTKRSESKEPVQTTFGEITADTPITTDVLSDEQLLMWSAQGPLIDQQ